MKLLEVSVPPSCCNSFRFVLFYLVGGGRGILLCDPVSEERIGQRDKKKKGSLRIIVDSGIPLDILCSTYVHCDVYDSHSVLKRSSAVASTNTKLDPTLV